MPRLDGRRHYLHLLVDNFSRCIIAHRLEVCLSGTTVRQMLSDAIERYHPSAPRLLTDGGPENCNTEVNSLTDPDGERLLRMVALRDIDFSNSMVKAVNRTIKGRYLRRREIGSTVQLAEVIESTVHDYNEVRPHHSLNGLTPAEALRGITVDTAKRSQDMRKAREARVAVNRTGLCGNCP